MIEIVPAILASDKSAFDKRILDMEKGSVKRIQVDFADGDFVLSKTLMPADLGQLNLHYIWEAHLMVANPEQYIEQVKSVGFACAAVHIESTENIETLAKKIHEAGLESLLAINPDTDLDKLGDVYTHFDGVLLMSVVPGFQGQQFIEETYSRIEKLKKRSENFIIEVDGGIKLEHVRKLKEMGVSRLVIGSALAGDDFKDSFERFETEIQA